MNDRIELRHGEVPPREIAARMAAINADVAASVERVEAIKREYRIISGHYPTEHGSCEPYITVEVQ